MSLLPAPWKRISGPSAPPFARRSAVRPCSSRSLTSTSSPPANPCDCRPSGARLGATPRRRLPGCRRRAQHGQLFRKVAVSPSFAAALSFNASADWHSGKRAARAEQRSAENGRRTQLRSGAAGNGPTSATSPYTIQRMSPPPFRAMRPCRAHGRKNTVEETAVPGDVIFAAATEGQRPVEALGERRRSSAALESGAPNRRHQRADGRVRSKACRAAWRFRRHEPPLAQRRAPSQRCDPHKSGFQQVASKHLNLTCARSR